jgi:multiple sugar transport system ATP-binding protein
MASVTFEHVVKKYGNNVIAVNDFSLEIRDQEFLVLVGPSGCGKTTALRLIAGLEEVSSGVLRIGDRIVNDVAPKDRDVAMVFQNYALYPHMSVFDNMAFGLKLRHVAKADIQRRVEDAANQLGLKPYLSRRPRELSGGQRQRVALGRAIVRDPQVFLMDEPLSNLDAKLRVQTRAELSKLHQRLHTTTIYVTHDQIEAMTMGERIAVMRDGILLQLDTPQRLYAIPDNKFVAGFIGSPAMNFLDVSVLHEGRVAYFKALNVHLGVPAPYIEPVAPYDGGQVALGIRPENIHDARFVADQLPDSTVTISVEVVEPMGSEVYVYGNTGDQALVARLDNRTSVKPGDKLSLYFDMSKMHAFDPQTELNLLRGDVARQREQVEILKPEEAAAVVRAR